MRSKARIPIILRNIPMEEFIESLEILEGEHAAEIAALSINEDTLRDYWEENPDLRLTQVLVNLEIIPNTPGGWYSIEEDAWMVARGYLQDNFLDVRLPSCSVCGCEDTSASIRNDGVRRCFDCESDRDFYNS